MLSYWIIQLYYPCVSVYIQLTYPFIISCHIHANLQIHNLSISRYILIVSFQYPDLLSFWISADAADVRRRRRRRRQRRRRARSGRRRPPHPHPPVVRIRLCWPGDRRWNKNKLLAPLMSRFDRAAAATSRNSRESNRIPSRRNRRISKDTTG
jgi:hypothetical protein